MISDGFTVTGIRPNASGLGAFGLLAIAGEYVHCHEAAMR